MEKWRYFWWLGGLIWTEVQKSSLSVCMSSKSNRIETVGVLKEKEKGIMTVSPQQEGVINKPEPKI